MGSRSKSGPTGLPSAETKDSYTFTITITDSADNNFEQEVTFHVVNHAELSIPTSVAQEPLWVPRKRAQVVVPVNLPGQWRTMSQVIRFRLGL